MRTRRAFTMAELMVGFLLTVIICMVLYEMFISGSRSMTRSEHKLDYMKESTLVFLYLKRDLHTAIAKQLEERDGRCHLVIDRREQKDPVSSVEEQRITWTLGVHDGKKCILRRRGTDLDTPPQRFCVGTVSRFDVEERRVPDDPAAENVLEGLEIIIEFDARADATSTTFRRTIFLHSRSRASSWIPLPPE